MCGPLSLFEIVCREDEVLAVGKKVGPGWFEQPLRVRVWQQLDLSSSAGRSDVKAPGGHQDLVTGVPVCAATKKVGLANEFRHAIRHPHPHHPELGSRGPESDASAVSGPEDL